MWSITGTVVGIVGLGINVYLLYQVNRLKEAKQEEREFMQRVLDIDKLDYILTLAADTLRDSDGVDDTALTEEILRARGQLEGALQAIEELDENELSSSREYHVNHFEYYNRGFLNDKLPEATDVIRIVCFRNERLASYSVREVLAERIQAGVSVELFSMSPTLPDEVLGRAGSDLPNPTAQGDKIRREIEQNFETIQSHMESELTDDERQRFDYWFYEEFPKVHLVQVDDVLYVAIPHYASNKQLDNVEYDGELLDPCLRLPATSPIGRYMLSNVDHLRQQKCTPGRDCVDRTRTVEFSE